MLTRRADWADWSAEYERKRLEGEIRERTRIVNEPIYPGELAKQIALDAARRIVPDWRLLRGEHGRLLTKLVRQQPESQQREVQQLEKVLRLLQDNLPKHLQPLINDLQTVYEFRAVAREAAAFHVGIETGRALAAQHVDAAGRLRSKRLHATIVREPDSVAAAAATETPEFRLHYVNNTKTGDVAAVRGRS